MKIFTIIMITLLSVFLLGEECSEKKTFTSVIIAPNPADDHIELTIELSEDVELNISIFDSNGNLIMEPVKSISYRTGESRISIQTNSLSPGMYFCRLQAGMSIETQKFVIVR
jgi:hypothetical protein